MRGTYGDEFWSNVVHDLKLGFSHFEPMFRYEPKLTENIVDRAAGRLGKTRDALLEDFGTFLIVDKRSDRVRRLLRFGGVTFTEFLHSLEDLPGRARLAVPEIDMPEIELDELPDGQFVLSVCHSIPGFGHVILGSLRALADDYGTLALLEHDGRDGETETISVQLLDVAYAEGRRFDLAVGAG